MDINKYTIQDPILAQAWDALINGGAYTIVNNEIVVRRDAAKRIYAAIGSYYNLHDVNKEFLTKKDFEQMYTKKSGMSLQYSIKEDHQVKPKVNITIKWKPLIRIEDFKNGQLGNEDKKTADLKNVVYIFIGYNAKRDTGIDVGQTSRRFGTRIDEHITNKDFLEGYDNNQVVFCGEVTCERSIDRSMLEQIEGVLIQYLSCHQNEKYNLCNDKKVDSTSTPYAIGHIYNEDTPTKLFGILPTYIPEED